MADCCSPYCNSFKKCDGLGILRYMKILNKHPSEVDKKWCESFNETEDSKE